MLTKKLVFALGLLFFMISIIGLWIFKVDEIPVKITGKSIQSQMDSHFYIKDTSAKTGVTYEILDPTVDVLDSGDVSFKLDVTFTAKPEVEWGIVQFVSKLVFDVPSKSFYLEIPDKVELLVSGKSSNAADFQLWNKDSNVLVADMTKKINILLTKEVIFSLKGGNLRLQVESYTITHLKKSKEGLNLILDVTQGLAIFIIYAVMLLSFLTFACGYFFVGGVAGFKDPDDRGFHDPRAYAKRRRPGDKKR